MSFGGGFALLTAGLGVFALVLLAGCTAGHHYRKIEQRAYQIIDEKQQQGLGRTDKFSIETPADTLRRQLLVGQKLPYAGPASLGTENLPAIKHWPGRPRTAAGGTQPLVLPTPSTKPLVLSLNDALQIAAANNRQYQTRKETVFSAALDLEFERDQFRTTFASLLTALFRHDRAGLNEEGGSVSESVETSAFLEASRAFKQGSIFSLRLGWNLFQLLQPERFSSHSFFGDASIQIPLLRGAGRHIAAEPLTQAERNALYAVLEFEEFKRAFAVQVAGEYLEALQRADQVKNAEENYRGLIASSRRARRLLDAGNLPPIQVDQAMQDELSARNRWISALESQTAALDSFNVLLGLPTDAAVELNRAEAEKLAETAKRFSTGPALDSAGKAVPPADSPIVLEPPSRAGGGRFELEPEQAIRIALDQRLDLRAVEGAVLDAQRRVVIAADRLKPELTLFGRARVDADQIRRVRLDRGNYQAFFNFEPPLERTAEAIAFRESFIRLEQAVRELQELEDQIKLGVRERLRTLREARESLQIQAVSVELARRRVRGADLNLQAGRVQIRDLLEAQEDLLGAQNALTAAAVGYRLAELQIQRDLGVLEVGADGLWREFDPANLDYDIAK